jgi:hypothetical protein
MFTIRPFTRVGCKPVGRVGEVSLTEIGFARIMAQSGYKNPVTTTRAIDLLAEHPTMPSGRMSFRYLMARASTPSCILGPGQVARCICSHSR